MTPGLPRSVTGPASLSAPLSGFAFAGDTLDQPGIADVFDEDRAYAVLLDLSDQARHGSGGLRCGIFGSGGHGSGGFGCGGLGSGGLEI